MEWRFGAWLIFGCGRGMGPGGLIVSLPSSSCRSRAAVASATTRSVYLSASIMRVYVADGRAHTSDWKRQQTHVMSGRYHFHTHTHSDTHIVKKSCYLRRMRNSARLRTLEMNSLMSVYENLCKRLLALWARWVLVVLYEHCRQIVARRYVFL